MLSALEEQMPIGARISEEDSTHLFVSLYYPVKYIDEIKIVDATKRYSTAQNHV